MILFKLIVTEVNYKSKYRYWNDAFVCLKHIQGSNAQNVHKILFCFKTNDHFKVVNLEEENVKICSGIVHKMLKIDWWIISLIGWLTREFCIHQAEGKYTQPLRCAEQECREGK